MKECCKTGDVLEQSKFKKYFNWFIYLFLIGIISFVLFKQLTS